VPRSNFYHPNLRTRETKRFKVGVVSDPTPEPARYCTIADLSPYTYPQQTVRPTHFIKVHLFSLLSEIDFLTLPRFRNPVGSCQGDAAQSYSRWVLGKIIGYIYWGSRTVC